MTPTPQLREDIHAQSARHTVIADACALTPAQMNEICSIFYHELLRRHPALQSYFADVALCRQATKLSSAIQLMFDYIRDPQRLGCVVVRVGTSHLGRRIGSAEYAEFIDVLADVLSRSQSRIPAEEARLIWMKELEPIVELMAIVSSEQ